MKLLINFLMAVSLIASTNSIFNGRSFRSLPAAYYARLNVASRSASAVFVAGGSLISYQHILCAASTLQAPNIVINVHVGGNTRGSQRVLSVTETRQHPDYDHTQRINDIGLLFLTQTLIFDFMVRPISLPLGDTMISLPANIQGQILGFGGNAKNNVEQGSETLEGAFVRITNDTYCKLEYNLPMSTTFCAEDAEKRSDFCLQDIGSGLTILQRGFEVIVGIASQPKCTQIPTEPSSPSLYTRVMPYVEWIRNETGL